MYLLFILLFPLVLGSFLLLAKPKNAFILSLAGSIIEAIAVAYVLIQSNVAPSTLAISIPWIPEAGLSFSLWVDGINGILIGLTGLLIPFIIGSTANTEKANNPIYQGLILAMQTALLGSFLAKDAFLFYFFFEASLLPIYFLSAQFGGEIGLLSPLSFLCILYLDPYSY